MLLHTVRWVGKINWGKTLLIALIYTAFATIIHMIEAMLTMKYYLMPQYRDLWSRLMMPTTSLGPPPIEFFITSIVFAYATGVMLTLVYYYIRDMLPKNKTERILYFADLLIGLAFIFFTLPTYLLFNVPVMLLVYWFISSFIIISFSALLIVRIID